MTRSRRPFSRSQRPHGRRGGAARPPGERRPAASERGASSSEENFPVSDRPLVHVAFRGCRCETFFNSTELVLRSGDYVLVEAERGNDLGRVIVPAWADLRKRRRQAPRGVLRHALPEEIEKLPVLIRQDQEALEVCQDRARHFNLEMKIIDAETQFDGNRITFYFTAEQRVDFRELVRDLAGTFRTRIELRQVGARDAARRCDGIGPCGRRLCCTTFLREFEPVTLKMAKDQSLPLNPAKISGSCGRLMCCLNYEAPGYHAAMRSAPAPGTRWQYGDAPWRVERVDVGNFRVYLVDEQGNRDAVDLERFQAEARAIVDALPEGEVSSEGLAPGPAPASPEPSPSDRPDD